MLQNLAAAATILGVLIPVIVAVAKLWSRLTLVEKAVEKHEQKIGLVDSLLERLARIEVKLDILMEERHGKQ